MFKDTKNDFNNIAFKKNNHTGLLNVVLDKVSYSK